MVGAESGGGCGEVAAIKRKPIVEHGSTLIRNDTILRFFKCL